ASAIAGAPPAQRLVLDHGPAHLATHVDLQAAARGRPLGRYIGEADAGAQAGGVRAAGHLAAAGDAVARPRDAALLQHEGDQPLGGTGLAHGAHRLGADEVRLLLAAPAQPRLDRPALRREVVAVEVIAHLQAQRVARGETRGDGAAA